MLGWKWVGCVTAAAAVLAAVASAAVGGELPGPMTVAIEPGDNENAGIVMPVSFEAPFAADDLDPSVLHYLLGSNGGLFACQVEAVDEPPPGETCRWARVRASVPFARRDYVMVQNRLATRPDIPVAGAVLRSGGATFSTRRLKVQLDAAPFILLRRLDLDGRETVAEYFPGLLNRQQAIEVVVTDIFRHADFALSPALAEDGFSVCEKGPVEAKATYRGAFSGRGDIGEIPFEATISLVSNGLVAVRVKMARGVQEREAFRLKSVNLRLPLLLELPSGVSFGNREGEVSGRESWRGVAKLAVDADGSYKFDDGKGLPISGEGGVTWISYGDRDAGVAIFPQGDAGFEFAADCKEDLIELAVTPVEAEDGSYEVTVYYLFHAGRLRRGFAEGCAEALLEPATATVDAEYIEAMTGAR